MLHDFFDRDSGPWLAVIDGRFLPIESFTVDLRQQTQPVTNFQGRSTGVQTRQTSLELELRTKRNPMMRDQWEMTQRVFVFTDDRRLVMKNIDQQGHGLSTGVGGGYELSFNALDWEIEER